MVLGAVVLSVAMYRATRGSEIHETPPTQEVTPDGPITPPSSSCVVGRDIAGESGGRRQGESWVYT